MGTGIKTNVVSEQLPGGLKIVMGLLVFSVFINYVDRGNLSIAAPMIKDELGISATQLGLLLSAFFWTYAFCQLVAGWLLVVGFRVRESLIALGFVLVTVTYGHLLKEPLYSFTGHVIPRLALLVFVALLIEEDRFSIDRWWRFRRR